MSKMRLKTTLVIIVILSLVVILWLTLLPKQETNEKNLAEGKINRSLKTTRETALSCTSDKLTRFHIHPHLEIIIEGKKTEVPAEIGITSDCMRPLHTHDATGTIHIESPEKRDFTLADFFAVWEKPFNREQILDYKADEQHLVRTTINNQEVQDFEKAVLHDNDQIIISYEKKQFQ